jgi:hypothetical protein
MPPAPRFRELPPMSTIDAVIDVARDHATTYKYLCVSALCVGGIALFLSVLNSDSTDGALLRSVKVACSSGIALIGALPYKQWLNWRARVRVFCDFKTVVSMPGQVSEAIRSRMSERFWQEYDRWWKAK